MSENNLTPEQDEFYKNFQSWAVEWFYDAAAKVNIKMPYIENGYWYLWDNDTKSYVKYGEAVGPQGYQGKEGKQGQIGNTGPQGTEGAQGPQGVPGNFDELTPEQKESLRGPQGYQGNDGSQGPKGDQGEPGGPGDQGPQGVQGVQGSQGTQGPQGVQGSIGEQGAKGLQGDIGPIGEQGKEGNQGPQGSDGADGADGNQGPNGDKGPQGDIGPQGTQGPDGNQGTQGPQGFQGHQGHDGKQGSNGNQGPIGDQGPDGNQGPDGAQGPVGDQGPVGEQGPQGEQGAPGSFENEGKFGYQDGDDLGFWKDKIQIESPMTVEYDPVTKKIKIGVQTDTLPGSVVTVKTVTEMVNSFSARLMENYPLGIVSDVLTTSKKDPGSGQYAMIANLFRPSMEFGLTRDTTGYITYYKCDSSSKIALAIYSVDTENKSTGLMWHSKVVELSTTTNGQVSLDTHYLNPLNYKMDPTKVYYSCLIYIGSVSILGIYNNISMDHGFPPLICGEPNWCTPDLTTEDEVPMFPDTLGTTNITQGQTLNPYMAFQNPNKSSDSEDDSTEDTSDA